MSLAAQDAQPDRTLIEELGSAPDSIRQHSDPLNPIVRDLPDGPMLDGVAQLYDRLVDNAIARKNRHYYVGGGALCRLIRSIRCVQGREADSERYCESLFATYSRFSALKDELR